jgi:tetratricopeptide (TPR) repeat protein
MTIQIYCYLLQRGKTLFFLSCLIAMQTAGLSQSPIEARGNIPLKKEDPKTTGKSYALITGISRYQANDSYQNLQYADVDAREFYNYIVSPKGANIASQNVDTLFNENASFMEFWRKFNRIKEQLQKNDLFYIYFSGHGDAYRADEAYLLAYDAPAGNDRNNYSTGVGLIDIHKLKVRIQEITGNGTQVILITDACRSNELPGKDEGQAISYQQIFERKAGEIQLISCASNQVSFEGSQWGGGRGLFSWHLINGLRGMADTDPEDGEVTLTELYDYVKKNVNKASYDAKTKNYRQTPQYCCSPVDGKVMSKVDKSEKEKLVAMLERGVTYTPDKNDFAVNKSVHLGSAMKEAGLEELYRVFLKAINEGRLIDKGGANDILKEILAKKETSKELADELKFVLSSKLMTDVAKVINTYLRAGQNNNKYTYDYFMTAAQKLHLFEQLADTLYYNPLDVKVNLLFLEGHANWRSFNTEDMRRSLKKVDSAVALKPQAAYLYNLKGLLHISLKQFKEGQIALKKGLTLAPNWLYPYHNLGSAYNQENKFDSAIFYYRKALDLDSNYQTTYGGISGMYSNMGNVDSAIYWSKAGLQKDATDAVLWTQLGYGYYAKKDWPNALQCFYNGMHYDSSFVYANEGALRVHMYDFKYEDSVKYYVRKMIKADSLNPVVYQSMGNLFTEFSEFDEAIRMFDISLELDSLNPDTWKSVGATYKAMGKDTAAIYCFAKALKIDSTDYITYNEMANRYFVIGMYKEAQFLFGKAILYNPENSVLYSNYGMASEFAGEKGIAETYYKKSLQKNNENATAYYQLAGLYVSQSKLEDAIKNLSLAIKYGSYTKADIENDTNFSSLKEDKGFKALLQKMK